MFMTTDTVQVRYWDVKDNGSVQQRVFRADDNLVILTDLFPYTKYAVTVLAYNAAGVGPANTPPLYSTTAESGKYLQIYYNIISDICSHCRSQLNTLHF